MDLPLRHVQTELDRHGRVRYYVRKRGSTRIRLRQEPGTEEFVEEHKLALAKLESVKQEPALTKIAEGTFGWLVETYQKSAAFEALASSTSRTRHLILESCLDEPLKPGSPVTFREFPLKEMTSKAIRVLRDRKKTTPAAAQVRMKTLRVMFDWAADECEEWVETNIVTGVKGIKYKVKGHHTWTREEVTQYEQRHPIGGKARLAMCIMLYTGVRRSDAAKLGPQHIEKDKDGELWLRFTPKKTERTSGKELQIPIVAPLKAILDASALGKKAFLETEFHKPFTAAGFGLWFRDRCDEASLPQCSAHGLRKIGAVICSEGGATVQQLMAIFGWETAQQAMEYVKKASQKKMAGDAMHLIGD
jgi:integrase